MKCAVPRLLLTVLLASGGCGGNTNPPDNQQDPPPSSGGDRLAWDQSIPAVDEPARYRFAVYVDSSRMELPSATCAAPQNEVAACTSPLPVLAPGRHVLELVSYLLPDAVESARAAPVVIVVPGTPTHLTDSLAAPHEGAALDEAVRDCSITPLGDGRALLTLASGQLRLVTLEGTAHEARLDWAPPDGQWILRGAAAHPGFAVNRLVYVLLSGEGDETDRISVVRYREAAGALGERAVIFDARVGIAAARPRLRVGPGASLLIGLFDGPTPAAGTRNRRFVIRLDERGELAADSRRDVFFMEPVLVRPYALDWPASATGPWSVGNLPRVLRGPATAATALDGPLPTGAAPGTFPVDVGIAAGTETTGHSQLWVVSSDGTVEQLAFDASRWSVVFRTSLGVSSVLHDARIPGGESVVAYCGSTSGSQEIEYLWGAVTLPSRRP
jgi:hypothetical protein